MSLTNCTGNAISFVTPSAILAGTSSAVTFSSSSLNLLKYSTTGSHASAVSVLPETILSIEV